MTCLMGDGSPGRRGTICAGVITAARTCPRSSKPLLATTWAVYRSSSSCVGTGTIDSVPTAIEATNWLAGVVRRYGLGPSGFGPLPRPLALVMYSSLPSGATATPVGYQAVGIRPLTRSPVSSLPPSCTTATSLLPAFATYSLSPETASAFGLLPCRASGYGARSMVRVTMSRLVSITDTVSLSELATYASWRAGLRARALGWVPTSSVWRRRPLTVSTTDTLRSPQLLTYALLPSSVRTTPYGFAPTPTVALTERALRSMMDSALPRLLAAYRVVPSAAMASPAGYGFARCPRGPRGVGRGIDAVSGSG